MIISNISRELIEQAAAEVQVRAEIDQKSRNSFRVKLYPSHDKIFKVEGGERIFYSHTVATRARLLEAFRLIVTEDAPELFLNKLLTARINSEARLALNIPRLPLPYDQMPAAMLAQAEKLAKAIVGRKRMVYKRVARYQRQSTRHDKAVGAVCWHGFRQFFFALFRLKPDARARTAYAKYDGMKGFHKNYPATAYRNIGSRYEPCDAASACWCSVEEEGPRMSANLRLASWPEAARILGGE